MKLWEVKTILVHWIIDEIVVSSHNFISKFRTEVVEVTNNFSTTSFNCLITSLSMYIYVEFDMDKLLNVFWLRLDVFER